uniref:Uncharacterized protein n=1 Tax=Mycena chlorophos TaxID=658473 RepID=A0ABQ0L369_MYCCL|nr:predicted protein [Mycena chlorophos]
MAIVAAGSKPDLVYVTSTKLRQTSTISLPSHRPSALPRLRLSTNDLDRPDKSCRWTGAQDAGLAFLVPLGRRLLGRVWRDSGRGGPGIGSVAVRVSGGPGGITGPLIPFSHISSLPSITTSLPQLSDSPPSSPSLFSQHLAPSRYVLYPCNDALPTPPRCLLSSFDSRRLSVSSGLVTPPRLAASKPAPARASSSGFVCRCRAATRTHLYANVLRLVASAVPTRARAKSRRRHAHAQRKRTRDRGRVPYCAERREQGSSPRRRPASPLAGDF